MTNEQVHTKKTGFADYLSHFEELRQRLIVSALAWLVSFAVCYSQAGRLFAILSTPLHNALPTGSQLVFIHATEPFFTYLKVSALAGALLALPVFLWQAWSFISPALYQGEKRLALPFVLASCLCFGSGCYFGFTLIFPQVFIFLISFGTNLGDINAMLSMAGYLTLCCRLLLAFGVVFELPIFMIFLSCLGVIDHHMLRRYRKYALLCGFVVGALLTPPDIFSQTAIALPFIVLYEVGIWGAWIFGSKEQSEASSQLS
ncbi:MAG: twin-arginine translocase subunit TatC [Desulfuromonas sp.]|nr:MAG: twin-arginine translocase subunit TatC [Desulfuromonas sp.]